MITLYLPKEMILHVMGMLADIRDIKSLYKTNKDIKYIIKEHFNNIIKNIIINNKYSYPQMSFIMNCCYKKNVGYINNSEMFHQMSKFISTTSKTDIIKEFNNILAMNREDIIVSTQISIYYYCRIIKQFTHGESYNATFILNPEDIVKMNMFLAINYSASDAIRAAQLTDEQVIKMNMIIKKNISVFDAIRAVNSLRDEDITKMIGLVQRNIPANNAIDAIEDLEDEQIEIMCQLFNEGIDPDVSRYASVYTFEHREILIKLFKIGVDIDMIVDIIENNTDDRIDWFVTMIEVDIDSNFALSIIEDEEMNEEKFNEFINLTKMNIELKMAHAIVTNFDNEGIIKFVTLVSHNINVEIVYDVINLFTNRQIEDFVKLLIDGIEAEIAYDMIMLYNENQRIMCTILIKNGIKCDLVENYAEEQISVFIRMVNEEHVDFNTAKLFIDSMEPPAKRRR